MHYYSRKAWSTPFQVTPCSPSDGFRGCSPGKPFAPGVMKLFSRAIFNTLGGRNDEYTQIIDLIILHEKKTWFYRAFFFIE
jgi:hypothetical protein